MTEKLVGHVGPHTCAACGQDVEGPYRTLGALVFHASPECEARRVKLRTQLEEAQPPLPGVPGAPHLVPEGDGESTVHPKLPTQPDLEAAGQLRLPEPEAPPSVDTPVLCKDCGEPTAWRKYLPNQCPRCAGNEAEEAFLRKANAEAYARLRGQGRKDDAGKLRWDLLPWRATQEVVGVLTFGAAKYAPENWRKVPGWRWRYSRAAIGHIADWMMGKRVDDGPGGSGRSPLANAVTCLLFLLEQELDGAPENPE